MRARGTAPPEAPVGAAEQPPDDPDPLLPLGGVTHWPDALHTVGETQSATDAHVLLHCPPLQT
jgi:hypothetical protein